MSGHELIADIAGAEELAPEWDALAVAASNPVACPAFVLAWWRHVAPADTLARVVAVRDGSQLIGVAPFHLASTRLGVAEYRLMADDFGVCMEPLAMPGREWEVAEAIGAALSATRPRAASLRFGPMAIASPWIAALSASWPGPLSPVVRRRRIEGAPVILLREPSYEDWLATLSSKLRRDLRRCERLFEEAGGTSRWSDAGTLRADAEAFARLHGSRWEGRGWSRLADLGERLPDWLEEVGAPLIGGRRFGLCVLEVDGEPICVDFHLSAGEQAAGVNVGWDERYARLAPAKLAVLRVVGEAYDKDCRRVGLGNGNLANKLRLANGNDPVAWTAIVPPSPRLLQAYALLLPGQARRHARQALARTLPEPWLEQVKGALARLRGCALSRPAPGGWSGPGRGHRR
ncbi:MAG: GNAT family N-acetyltransferase [Solirubrobacteraceae bacterium]